MRAVVGAVCALVLAAGVGCGDGFEPKWRVQNYRLLGIKSEPATVQPGEPATLSVLDYRPEGTSVSYSWEWCPLQTQAADRYECPVEDLQAAFEGQSGGSSGGSGGMPGDNLDPALFELGDGESVQLPYPGSVEQIRGFCEALQEALTEAGEDSPLASLLPNQDCKRGYDISVRLEATVEGKEETIVARKKVTLSTGGDQQNANPNLRGVEVRLESPEDIPKVAEQLDWVAEAGTPREEQWVDMPADRPLPVLVGIPYELRADIDPDSVETWRPPAPAGSGRELDPPEKEVIVFDWLTTRGDIVSGQRIFREDINDLEEAALSGWSLDDVSTDACPEAGSEAATTTERNADCDVYIWSLVRDGRLGIDWSERRVRLVRERGGS